MHFNLGSSPIGRRLAHGRPDRSDGNRWSDPDLDGPAVTVYYPLVFPEHTLKAGRKYLKPRTRIHAALKPPAYVGEVVGVHDDMLGDNLRP